MKIVKQTPTKLVLREQKPCWLVGLTLGPWLAIGLFPIFSAIIWPSAGRSALNFWEVLLTIFFLIWGISLIIFVLWCWVNSTKAVTYTFDKTLGRMTLKRQRPFSTGVCEHSIQEISAVELGENRNYGSYGTVSISYTVRLVLVSGRSITLTSMSLRGAQKIATSISAFLNVNNYGIEGAPKSSLKEFPSRTSYEERAHWQEAIRANPNNAEAHAKLGMALYQQGDKKEAEASIKQAIKLFKAQGEDEQASGVQLMWQIGRWQ